MTTILPVMKKKFEARIKEVYGPNKKPHDQELLSLYQDVLTAISKESIDFEARNLALAALGDKSVLQQTNSSTPMPSDKI